MAVSVDEATAPSETYRSLPCGGRSQSRGCVVFFASVLLVFLVLSMSIYCIRVAAQAGAFGEVGPLAIYEKVKEGQGDIALSYIALVAERRGGWTPAPGDEIMYIAHLRTVWRGGIIRIDDPPADCIDPKMVYRPDFDQGACLDRFRFYERLVQFGPALFSNPLDDGSSVPRNTLDDMLATYIEEVGHSWQEYFYETEGRGYGERTRRTTVEAGLNWLPGLEYQIKMYILSLDGTWLSLSDKQRQELHAPICNDNGYANPMGHPIPPYGPPSGWPNPKGWPTTAPALEQFQAFCDNMSA